MNENELLGLLLRRVDDDKRELLPVRARNVLPGKNIHFWGDLIGLSRGYFFGIPGIGDKTLKEIDDIFLRFGLFRGMFISPEVMEKFKEKKYEILRAEFRR